jgi:hypothetical protein
MENRHDGIPYLWQKIIEYIIISIINYSDYGRKDTFMSRWNSIKTEGFMYLRVELIPKFRYKVSP